MTKHRFFIENINSTSDLVELNNKDVIHQIQNVLRIGIGEKIIAFDGSSNEYELTLEKIMKNVLIFSKEIMKKKLILNKVSLTLCPAIIKKDKLEYVFQKCTEIGVDNFQPIISSRTEKLGINMDRVGKIIKEAAEQSHRNILPQVLRSASLDELAQEYETKHETQCETLNNRNHYYLDIGGPKFNLKQIKNETENKTADRKEVFVFIGPEGGWDDSDYKQLERLGAKPISLGENVLRAETASIVISALIILSN